MQLAKTIMIQGTASHVGKSVMTAALPLRICAETTVSAAKEAAVAGKRISHEIGFQHVLG